MVVNTGSKVDENILQFINAHWRGPKLCIICGTNAWNLEQNLAELRFLSVGSFHIGAPVVPLVVITCVNCGNTILINAMRAGWSLPQGGGQ
jgi:hypothetical protein